MYTPEYCKEHFKYLNKGSSRTVYEFDDNHVIKVPRPYSDGVNQNIDELRVYERFHNTFPLCYLDPRSTEQFIIMEKIRPLDEIRLSDLGEMNCTSIDLALWAFARCEYSLDNFMRKEFFNHPYDVRFMNFLTEISRNSVDIIEAILYDVCSFNLGMKDNRILMLDYGMFMDNLIKKENEENCLTE